jgi:hypothetical protein
MVGIAVGHGPAGVVAGLGQRLADVGRGHGLRAAGHGWTGAEDVREGRVPGACRLPIARTARKLWALLAAVVGHVSVRGVQTACNGRR